MIEEKLKEINEDRLTHEHQLKLIANQGWILLNNDEINKSFHLDFERSHEEFALLKRNDYSFNSRVI